MPWKPGQSGNPAGRKSQTLVYDARALTTLSLERLERLIRYAKDERVALAAISEALDRGWGKPAQAMTIDQNVTIEGGVDMPERPSTVETAEQWLARRRAELAALKVN